MDFSSLERNADRYLTVRTDKIDAVASREGGREMLIRLVRR